MHTAPGHGQEDYLTGVKYGLELLSPVDDAGRFTSEASQCGENLVGLSVLGDGNAQGTRNDPDSRLASPKRTENLSGLVLGCTRAKF